MLFKKCYNLLNIEGTMTRFEFKILVNNRVEAIRVSSFYFTIAKKQERIKKFSVLKAVINKCLFSAFFPKWT